MKVVIKNRKRINKNEFCNNKEITAMVIPATVKKIQAGTFDGCWNLKEVYFDGTIEDWCKIEFGDSSANPISNGGKLYLRETGGDYYLLTDLIISDGVKTIGRSAFAYYKYLTSICIADYTITSIGDYAFVRCPGLISVVISDGVKTIGRSAFYDCENLKILAVSDSVESIGDYAFWHCPLKSLACCARLRKGWR